METLLSLCMGVGLSAACGFRVFVPLLILGVAAHTGHLHLAPGFQWLGSMPALTALAVATVLEIGGYFIPWVDNFLDAVATPVAVLAGTVVTAALVTDLDPFLKWTLAIIAGGGAAGLVQGTTVMTRGVSSLSTGGVANPILATAELAGSLITSLLSLVMPALALVLLLALALFFFRRYWPFRRHTSIPTQGAAHRF